MIQMVNEVNQNKEVTNSFDKYQRVMSKFSFFDLTFRYINEFPGED